MPMFVWWIILAVFLFCIHKENRVYTIESKLTIISIELMLSLVVCISEFIFGEYILAVIWIIPSLLNLSNWASVRKSYKFLNSKCPPPDYTIRKIWIHNLSKSLNNSFLSCQTRGEVTVIQSLLKTLDAVVDTQDFNTSYKQ